MNDSFQALVLDKRDDRLHSEVTEVELDSLPKEEDGNVLVEVHYSALNYKDALGLTGSGKIVSHYPFIPGCEFVGKVTESDHLDFKPGDEVIATGFGIGERHFGGFSQFAQVPGNWLVKLPKGMNMRDAITIGTPGLTAMFAIEALEHEGVHPGQEVLVTGASGGVGSFSIALLHKLGYHAIASTGKTDSSYLTDLGAEQTIPRSELEGPPRPLARQRFDAAIDSIGGNTLANILSQTRYEGTVAACGLVGGHELPATVYPFILRGVRLVGIDSVMQPVARRVTAWERLHELIEPHVLNQMVHEIPLHDVPRQAEAMMRGELSGRTVVRMND
ncbi:MULTISPECIES: MDR family oxidoreductase [unclassified Exiguobacterium]|uniref:MDR family oxidoreductase n=1 Tax=unclassified Exiguobacterium TaxID=2644629 RepID=UPI00103DBA7A|nr:MULTISPECIES: MDR family oxidoreductase [unclassified Exiguobacterium]TCI36491.1 oxidoreductase [Exiguobacterium sp. SH4S7]TCI48540.1 oxidoreductase [Exiguobacterium sp. SH5S32]TCI55426.1 oxidoreductase [Exiguobacterium sp. SH1S4]TCI75221.1 oxidoreductase [Exiguobacterium sp. SH1S1]